MARWQRGRQDIAHTTSASGGARVPVGRALLEASLRVLELVLIATVSSFIVGLFVATVVHREIGAMVVLISIVVGSVMIFGGFMSRTTPRPSRNTRRLERERERALEQANDPVARARAEAEARAPKTFVSQGGITATAGLLVIVLGFVIDALFFST